MAEKGKGKKEVKAGKEKVRKAIAKEKKSLTILSVRIGDFHFAVRREDFLDISGGSKIHHLPLTPPHFEGIVDYDGVTTYVFDLTVMAGINSKNYSTEKVLLIVSKKKPATAFSIDELESEEAFSPESILPLPAYLKTPLIDSAVIKDDHLLPLININKASQAIQSDEWQGLAPSLAMPSLKSSQKISAEKGLKLFSLGGETFASCGSESLESSVGPEKIHFLPGLPDFVCGISFYKGKVLTLIDTSLRIRGQKGGATSKVLISDAGGDLFGFFVDNVRGNLAKGKNISFKLPAIAEKPWAQDAIIKGKEGIVLINLPKLLIPDEVEEKKEGLHIYKPDPSLESRFTKEAMTIRDFTIAGRQYALPGDQVKEVIPFRQHHHLPWLPSIIVGVAEHGGTMLPVIDIATCFGFHSKPSKGWKLIHLVNGDFSALILAQAVFDVHELKAKDQKRVPVVMKHRFLYGCYPDNETKVVRLILDVHKLTVYFDEERVRDVFTSMANVEKPAIASPSEEIDKASNAVEETSNNVPPQENEAAEEETCAETPQTKAEVEIAEEKKGEESLDEKEKANFHENEAFPDREEIKTIHEPSPKIANHDKISALKASLPVREEPMAQSQSIYNGGNIVGKALLLIIFLIGGLIYLLYGYKENPAPVAEKKLTPPAATKIEQIINKGHTQEKRNEPLPPEKEVMQEATRKEPAKTITRKGKSYPVLGEFDFYTVREGDTLWEIAAAYSKDPHDYNLVAEDNRIITPDLIYPGQKLRLQKKWKDKKANKPSIK